MRGRALVSLAAPTLVALFAIGLAPLTAQFAASRAASFASADEARAALDSARQQQRNARARGERLERQAAQSSQSADKALRAAAALAARIQQSEAGMTAAAAELALIARQRRAIDRALAVRREPLVRLTGALQAMARRPLTLAAFQPGSLRDLVYTRAVIDGTVPRVRAMTAGLRGELDRARALERGAGAAVEAYRDNSRQLTERRRALVSLAQSQRLTARRVAGDASREEARALALAEEARDLDGLVTTLAEAGSLRDRLAALPGPVARPANPEAARVARAPPEPSPSATAPPAGYQLPVTGRVLAGFGEAQGDGGRQSGIVMAPPPGAQVIAPGAGRIAFAGPYRGYGRIVIIEHGGGWTSLVTGLASLDTEVGREVAAGSPLGLAARRAPRVTLELRSGGAPVNPLDHTG